MNNIESKQHDLLEKRVRQVLSEYVLKTSGVSKQNRKDPIQYVSTLFKHIRNVEYLKRFQTDIAQITSIYKSSLDKSSQMILLKCFNRIVDCIENGGVNEITVNAARKCFISLALEIIILNQEHALSVLDNCIQLSAGEILVLQAYYDSEKNSESAGQLKNWLAALCQHTGIELTQRLETHIGSLQQKKLLHKNESTMNNPGKAHHLSELGTAIALSMEHGEKFLRANLSSPHTND